MEASTRASPGLQKFCHIFFVHIAQHLASKSPWGAFCGLLESLIKPQPLRGQELHLSSLGTVRGVKKSIWCVEDSW
jgi:hypothetical protein